MKSPLMAAFVAATLAFAHDANAQDDDRKNDRYWGVGFGAANVEQSTNLYGGDDENSSNTIENAFFGLIARDAAGESGIGFEAGYIGNIDTNYAAFGRGASADIDMSSLYLAAVGTILLSEDEDDGGRREWFVKVGIHSWDFEATGRGTLSGKDSDDGSDWFYGVGIDHAPADRKGLIVRTEYVVFPAEPEITVITSNGATEAKGDYKAELFSVSLIWRF